MAAKKPSPPREVTPREYWDLVGRDTVKRVCVRAGTEYVYFKFIANKWKRPSIDLALKLHEASKEETPGLILAMSGMLIPKEELRQPPAGG